MPLPRPQHPPRRLFPISLTALAINLMLAPAVLGQGEDEVGLDTLAQRADRAYAENPENAIPFLLEIRERLKDAEDIIFRELLAETLFRLGLIQMRAYVNRQDRNSLEAAVEIWDDFITRAIADPRLRQAFLNRANSLFILGNYQRAAADYARLLEYPYSEQLTRGEFFEVLERKALSLLRLEEFDRADLINRRILELAEEPRLRLFAMNGILDHIARRDAIDDVVGLLPVLRRDRLFRFDLGINLRLLSFGDELGERERFAEAGLFYAAVVPVSDLLRETENRIVEIEEILVRQSYRVDQRNSLVAERLARLEQRSRLLQHRGVTGELLWRKAIILQKTGRRFESFFAFRRLMEEQPGHERIEQFHYSAFLQAIACEFYEDAIELGELYLLENHYARFERFIYGQLGLLYYRTGDLYELERVTTEFVDRFPEDFISAQLVHQLGTAWFRTDAIDRVLTTFPDWVRRHPEGNFHDAALYWQGMAHLFNGFFDRALAVFTTLQADFPGSVYRAEAEFREAVCHFGLEDYPRAQSMFTAWVEARPEHPLRPEAEVFLGDIAAIEARVDEALAHYARVEPLGGSGRLIDHAAFESAELLRVNRRLDEHQSLLMDYLSRHETRAAAPLAVLRMAEVDLERNQTAEAFHRLRLGIDLFGNRRDNDAVDQILDRWWSVHAEISGQVATTRQIAARLLRDSELRQRLLTERLFQINFFRENSAAHPDLVDGLRAGRPLRQELQEAITRSRGAENLEIDRLPSLRTVLAKIDDRQLGLPENSPEVDFTEWMHRAFRTGEGTLALRLLRVLVSREITTVDSADFLPQDWDLASPGTAVWMAEQLPPESSEEYAERLLAVWNEFPDSVAGERALFLLARQAEQDNLIEVARERYQRLLTDYGQGSYEREANLGLGRMHFAQGDFDAAITVFSNVLQERNWRGAAWAEATLMIGKGFLALNQPRKAQGFFERTYLAFAGMDPWAGLATLESGQILESMGEIESARRTYRSYLDQVGQSPTSVADRIRERLAALPAAPTTAHES